jgi:hypothetical protein
MTGQTGHQWLTPVTLVTWEAKVRSIETWGLAQENCFPDHITKITRATWIGGVVEGTEHLLCNHKALSSILNSTIYQKKKKYRWRANEGLFLFCVLIPFCMCFILRWTIFSLQVEGPNKPILVLCSTLSPGSAHQSATYSEVFVEIVTGSQCLRCKVALIAMSQFLYTKIPGQQSTVERGK